MICSSRRNVRCQIKRASDVKIVECLNIIQIETIALLSYSGFKCYCENILFNKRF